MQDFKKLPLTAIDLLKYLDETISGDITQFSENFNEKEFFMILGQRKLISNMIERYKSEIEEEEDLNGDD